MSEVTASTPDMIPVVELISAGHLSSLPKHGTFDMSVVADQIWWPLGSNDWIWHSSYTVG